jgi:excisionase family DNA binding protein
MQTESLTLTIEEVAAVLGIGRTLAYDLARRDELPVPVLRLGRRLVVSRVALERTLGFDDVRERSGPAPTAPAAA